MYRRKSEDNEEERFSSSLKRPGAGLTGGVPRGLPCLPREGQSLLCSRGRNSRSPHSGKDHTQVELQKPPPPSAGMEGKRVGSHSVITQVGDCWATMCEAWVPVSLSRVHGCGEYSKYRGVQHPQVCRGALVICGCTARYSYECSATRQGSADLVYILT